MLGPVTNLYGPSGFVAVGYGMAITRPGIVNITSAQLSLVPSETRFTFDTNLNVVIPPYSFEARAPADTWRFQTIKSGTGPNWQEWLWSWGSPLPVEYRCLTYPTGHKFVDGYLDIPVSGLILPVVGGLISSVEDLGSEQIKWNFANADLIGVAGVPIELEVYTPAVGWKPAYAVDSWAGDHIITLHDITVFTPTLWRLNVQPTSLTFTSGDLAIPQIGNIP